MSISEAPTEPLIDTIHFRLDRPQAEIADWFLREKNSITSVIGVRGSGKSALIIVLVGMLQLAGKKQIIYASHSSFNTENQFKKFIDNETVKEYLYHGPDYDPWTTKPLTLRWANGGETILWSMQDATSKEGFHPDALILDESQLISESAWSKTLYPMRKRMGADARIICFGSCPDTDGHWFWLQHQEGLNYPNESDCKSFTFTTENSLTFKGKRGVKFLAEAQHTMSKRDFSTQFQLKPGGMGDCYFNSADIDACVAAYNPAEVDKSQGTLLAYDPANGTQDPAAYTIIDLKGNIFLSHSINQALSDTDQVKELVDKATEEKSLVCVESNSTPWMTYAGALKTLLPHGVKPVPFRNISTKSQVAKNVLIKQFAWLMENKMIRINPECKDLIKQLKSLRDYKLPSGALEIKAPSGKHDDEAFMAVIAAHAFHSGWSPSLGGGTNRGGASWY